MSERITGFLQEHIDAGDFPSASYLVAEKGEIVFQGALGNAVVDPERIPARVDTIYDLASLTKPLVTGLLLVHSIEAGELDPNESIGNILNEFYTSANADLTINDLAMHMSGLPDWKPFYLLVRQPDNVLTEISQTFAVNAKEDVIYSDLNFITLGCLLERAGDAELDEIFHEKIEGLLGLQDTKFNPFADLRSRIAASEKGNEYERQTCQEKYPELRIPHSAFRTHQIWGEVHDGNAHFMGGVAGHAGLFSTAEEVFKLALQFLPGYTKLLKPETCELFRTNFTKGMNEDRSFAFQLASTADSTAGTKMPPQSFGHNGFTGTSLWIDPVNERIFILLTNRTHTRPLPFANINSVRRKFHDIAIDELQMR